MNITFKGYFKNFFLNDLKAGFITAIVAIPLAIGFAIASGVSPIMGLYTAIIAGILASLFGGSIFSITGPTGAMTIIILSTVTKYGIEGLLLAGFIAGFFQIIFGLLKIGNVIKIMPLPIITGFTAGIGALIFIGQIPNSLGINVSVKEHVWENLSEIIVNIGQINLIALILSISTIFILIFLPRLTKNIRLLNKIPASLIALIFTTFITFYFAIQVPIVGEIPHSLPKIEFINFNFILLKDVLGAGLTIALLGSIEALLCAVVCDGMTNTKHKSNKELISQGVVNMILPFFNAIPSTAAIARSAVVIREGAKTRFAGVIHGIIIFLTVIFFAGFAYFIPKAFLAGILMFISFKMIDLNEMKSIIKISKRDTVIMIITMALTVFTDLVFAVEVGFVFALVLLFIRLLEASNITSMEDYDNKGLNYLVNSDKDLKDKIMIYTIHGPFFFGAMNVFERRTTDFKTKKPYIIIRMKHVPFIDTTALARLNQFLRQSEKDKIKIFITGLRSEVKQKLLMDKEFCHLMSKKNLFHKTSDAVEYIKNDLKKGF